jgi:hypothetical protein
MGAWVTVIPGIPEPVQTVESGEDGSKAPYVATSVDAAHDAVSAVAHGLLDAKAPDVEVPRQQEGEFDAIQINVLGALEIGPGLTPPNRQVLLELACYLAMHRKAAVSTEELQMALSRRGDASSETSAKSVRTYMSELRRWLGAEHVPSARGSGYRLGQLVRCDWELFCALSKERSGEPEEQIRSLAEALNLVRGRPFAGTNFRWVDAELLVSEMEVAIAEVARRLGALAKAMDLQHLLWFAGRRAVLGCPYDVGLWETALEGAAGHDASELERTWHDAQVTLGDEVSALDEVATRLGLR